MAKEEIDDVSPTREEDTGDVAPDANPYRVAVDPSQFRRMSAANPELVNVVSEAARGAESERSMTFWQALKLYPKAVGWSMLLSTALVMEGFDVGFSHLTLRIAPLPIRS
jgi:SP family general alpha glucoside:H+ symporter-like MFS transporter